MYGYKVEIESNTDHYEHDGEKWGSWSESRSHTLNTIVRKVDSGPDITSSLDIPKGTQALVLWVVWSSGDSFGHCSGAYAEPIAIFTDIDAANELKSYIERGAFKDQYRLNYTTIDDQYHTAYAGWVGYFESLDSVNIDVVTVF